MPIVDDSVMLNQEIQRLCRLKTPDAALGLLLRLEERSLHLSESSYRALFRVCNDYLSVKKLQAHLKRVSLDLAYPFGELLVLSLSKYGNIQEALEIFYALPRHTVFSWSVVLAYYADRSDGPEVLRLYECMQKEGVHPNEYTYVSLFKACGSMPDLKKGIALHMDAKARGYESSIFVVNTLISMYGKCRMITEAENVFFSMAEPNLVSWNAMISAYLEHGKAHKALHLYRKMQKQGVNPNNRTFVLVLQSCCLLAEKEDAIPVNNKSVKLMALVSVHKIHKDVLLRGLESDSFVGNSLMKAYSKCGGVGESQAVFFALQESSVVTWNTLLSVFIEHGRGEKALRLYRQMKEEGVVPDERTFVNAVQACCLHADKEEPIVYNGKRHKLMCLEVGQGLHADARKMGFASNLFLCNTLVTLYGKCGSLLEAENIVGSFAECDIVTWTALLSGYVEQGKAKEALLLYKGIYEEGMVPDERTFSIVLHACSILSENEEMDFPGGYVKMMCLHLGQALHLDAQNLQISTDPFIVSGLIYLYGRCGYVAEAEMVFGSSLQKKVISWNAMLSMYNEQGEAKMSLKLYRQMEHERVVADERTFVIVLQSCCYLAQIESDALESNTSSSLGLEIGQSLHAAIKKRGLDTDSYISTALVSLYSKYGKMKEAESVFVSCPWSDTKLWNAMLSAYLDQGEAEKSLKFFTLMFHQGVILDKGTCIIALQAVCALAEKETPSRLNRRFVKSLSLRIGEKLHTFARHRGFDSDAFVGTVISSMYGKCRCIQEAEAVFAELPQKTTLSWNTMLSAYVEQGLGEQAVRLYEKMKENQVTLDEISISCLLQVSGMLEDKDLCRHVHFIIVSSGCDESIDLASTLIHAYGQCSLSADAEAIFSKLPLPDPMSWSALIAGYARGKRNSECLDAFEEMIRANIEPTGLTFLSVLLACSQAGLVDIGLGYFKQMYKDYNVPPELDHHVTVIELLYNAGEFQMLKEFVSTIPDRHDPTFWFGILVACQKYQQRDLEDLVLTRATHLQRSHPKGYRSLVGMASGQNWLHDS
ncbi:hypothetical protein KP509_33G035100 [Ceratopteris richardii]|nr:hypothetical protein KP509_33G035100 [Ceratopteris richardii]